MKPKKAVKELEKQLRKDPENLVLRLRLAAALRELGRTDQAVTLYRSVAVQYHSEGRLAQAVAVCKSVLEIDPNQRETQSLLAELERMLHAQAPADTPGAPPPQSPPAQAPPSSAPPESPPPPPRAPPTAERSQRIAPGPATARRVRVFEPPPRGLARPPARDDFARPSGLTPSASDLEVPSLATPGSYTGAGARRDSERAVDRDSRPPGVPSRRRSANMASQSAPEITKPTQPPRMKYGGSSSKLRITPTPLPPPSVDDDESVATNPNREPVRPRTPSPPPLETPTGEIPSIRRNVDIDDDDVDDDALTTVAPESGWRPPARGASARRPAVPPPTPSDARPTAPLEDSHSDTPVEPVRAPAPGRPDVFQEATRFGDSLAEVGHAAMRPPKAPAPEVRRPRNITRNTLRLGSRPRPAGGEDARQTNPLLERPPPRPPRRRPPPRDSDSEDVTGVRRAPRGKPPGRSFDPEDDATRVDDGPPPALLPDHEAVDEDELHEEGMSLERAFDGSFSEAIDRLAPDGAAIDAPLTIFSDLPEPALEELVRRMSLRSFRAGEIVLREGDPGNACFVIASGSVRVLKRDPSNKASDLIELARLGSGAVFGEFALLADRRRHATVQAIESTEMYEVPRRLLRELAATYPDVGPALERFYRDRLLSTLLATAPFFSPLAEDRRGELLARFSPMRCESGQRIIVEGEQAGGLYLIVLGSVEITKRVSERRSVLLTTLGEGAYFGELSLMRGGTARATVTAVGPTELAVLPAEDFYEVVSANPVLWEEIRKEAHRRELMLRQLVTGETGVV